MLIYMKVTKDEFELPVAIADSMSELGRICGCTKSSISHALKDQKTKGRKTTYVVVEIYDECEETI